MRESVSTRGRLVYIEPNDFAAERGARFGNGVNSENVYWNPEDLNFAVDLQVVVPNRSDCGEPQDFNVTITSLGNFVSFFGGTTINKEQSLTTDYINASYTEIRGQNVSSKECLGINSIDIKFDSHFYPIVNMSFTDVRASSLFMPGEEEYLNEMRRNSGVDMANYRQYTNFFRALFHFPYPRFLLSIKGYYGNKVTFILAVNDFKSALNSSTGNFDVNISFIGYMYGIYTEIPMNLLIIAPYIGIEDGETTNTYWNSKKDSDFRFSEGRSMVTFLEYLYKFGNIDVTLGTGASSSTLRDYRNVLEKKDKLIEIQDTWNGIKRVFLLTKGFNQTTLESDSSIIAFEKTGFTPGNSVFDGDSFIQKLDGLYQLIDSAVTSSFITAIYPNSSWSTASKEDLKDANNNYKVYQYYGDDGNGHFEFYDSGLEKELNEKIEEAKTDYESKYQEATDAVSNDYKNALGFTPTIENVFRMIFAHLDCFMHEYLTVCKNVKSSKRKIKDFNSAISNLEQVDVETTTKECFLPPYFGYYIINSNSKGKKIEYPGNVTSFANIPEVTFIDNIHKSFSFIGDKIRELNALLRSQSAALINDGTLNGDGTYTFTATSAADVFTLGKNPYLDCFENTNADTEFYSILYEAYLRYLRWYHFKTEGDLTETATFATYEAQNLKATDKHLQDATLEKFNRGEDIIVREFSDVTATFDSKSQDKRKKSGNDLFVDIKGNLFFPNDDITAIEYNEDKTYIYVSDGSNVNNFINACYGDDNSPLRSKMVPTYWFLTHIMRYYKDTSNPSMARYYGVYKLIKGVENIEEMWALFKQYNGNNKSVLENISIETIFVLIKKENKSLALRSIFDINYVMSEEQFAYSFLCSLLNTYKTEITGNYSSSINIPKCLCLLYGCVLNNKFYLEKKFQEKVGKIQYGLERHSDDLSIYNIITTSDTYADFSLFFKNLSDESKESLKEYYKTWETEENSNDGILYMIRQIQSRNSTYMANTEQKEYNFDEDGSDMCLLTSDIERPTNNKCTVIGKNHPLHSKLLDLIFSTVNITIIKKSSNENPDNVKDFLKKFIEEYNTEARVQDTLSARVMGSAILDSHSKDFKKALYYTLKNLYDKWLCSYGSEKVFNLPGPGNTKKKARLTSTNPQLTTEFDNFLFVDSFYNDISKDFYVNPQILFKMINDYINSANNSLNNQLINTSVYEFMAELAQKNKLLMLALPVYNNFYNKDTIKDIFTPHTIYNDNTRQNTGLGSTYILMYTHEASKMLEHDSYDEIGYRSDGLDLADSLGVLKDDASVYFVKSNDEDNKLNVMVPAFGVTFAKQNQNYFTSINVNMDNPKVTDQSILNQLQLANSAIGGDLNFPFAIGQNIYSIYSNRSYTCTVEMLGCMNIMPMMYFQLNNVPMFKGAYMIISVTHNIVAGKMVTKFTGIRQSKILQDYVIELFDLNVLAARLANRGTTPVVVGQPGIFTGKDKSEIFEMAQVSDLLNTPKGTTIAHHKCVERGLFQLFEFNTSIGVQKLQFHKIAGADLQAICNEIRAQVPDFNLVISNTVREVNTIEGGTSRHCLGLAVDLTRTVKENGESHLTNPWFKHNFKSDSWSYNSVGSPPWGLKMYKSVETYNKNECIWSWDHPVVKIFNAHGWGWGGAYGDVMHFSLSPYPSSACKGCLGGN